MAQLQKILAHAHQQISQAKNLQDLDETVKAILDAIKATTNSKVPLTKLAISPVKDGTKVTRVGGVVIAADLIGSSKKSMVALVKRNDQKPVSSVLQTVEETKVTAQTKQLPLGFPENNDTKTNVSESRQKQEPVIHDNDLPVPNNEIGSSFSQSNWLAFYHKRISR